MVALVKGVLLEFAGGLEDRVAVLGSTGVLDEEFDLGMGTILFARDTADLIHC